MCDEQSPIIGIGRDFEIVQIGDHGRAMFGFVADASAGKATRVADVLDGLQLAIPFWAVVVMQWFVVRDFLRRREQERVAT